MTGYFRSTVTVKWLTFLWYKKEALLWIAALAALAFIDPYVQHSTLCPFHNLGWEFCPGCGIGRSIACVYHFDLLSSISTHPLGIASVALIIWRVIKVLARKEYYQISSNTIIYGKSF